jgi:hypothetical protein
MLGDELVEPSLKLRRRCLFLGLLLGSRALCFALALLDELRPRLALAVLVH